MNWNLNVAIEREFIKNNIIGSFIPKNDICPVCNKGLIGYKNKESILNPIEFKCNNYKCTRNFPIRKDTIFEFNPKIPISVLYTIINYWLVDSFNVSKIKDKLQEKYNLNNVDKRFIYRFIFNCRKIISNYLRNVYSIERLALKNANDIICADESLFTHEYGVQTWVVGLLNTKNDSIRLEVVSNRNEENIKAIITKHVGVGNTIYTDSWSAYNFLSRPDSGYIHNFVNLSHGIFGLTSRIEGLWGEIKSIIKKIYNSIHSDHFIYFLREAEYRRTLRSLNSFEILKDFCSVVSSVSIKELIDEDSLKDIFYDFCYDD